MKKLLSIIILGAISLASYAQVFKTSTGKVSFESKTPAENIAATNSAVKAAVDSKRGKVQFAITINSFQFSKSLMQKHFQENYMETTQYPTSSFAGAIVNNKSVKWGTDGTYNVSVKGKLTMHGKTNSVTIPGKIIIKDGKPTLNANFSVKPADYGIKIPGAVAEKIAKSVDIAVICACE
jgi:polyisoprenoid-binding protein YceI